MKNLKCWLWESIVGCVASSVVNWLVCIQRLESMAGCYCVKSSVLRLAGMHTDINCKSMVGVIALKEQC